MTIKLSHIGFVVQDIKEATEVFEDLGLKKMTEPEPDPVQKVTACFVSTGDEQDSHIELLQPDDETSPIANFLHKHGGGLHHLCFEVKDIDKATKELEVKGFQIISTPVECIGYDQSFKLQGDKSTRISFMLSPNKLLIELLEKGS